MAELTDHELLTRFARTGEEAAFATLVTRHVNLVWSAARRFTDDDTLAGEVTQAVFIILAQKAGGISAKSVLTGWLYQTARLTAANALKENRRRQQREHQAYMESNFYEGDLSRQSGATAEAWQQLAPVLDEAMHALRTADRDAVLLRYFENKSLADVGAALGVTEDAARVRVNRALDKLRALLAKQGLKFGVTILASAVLENSVQAAPVGLTTAISTRAISTAIEAGVGAKFLGTIVGAIGKFTPVKVLITILPATFLNWLSMRLDLGNFREREGFRARLFQQNSRWWIIFMALWMAAIFYFVPRYAKKLNLETLYLILGLVSLLAAANMARRLVIIRNRFFICLVIASSSMAIFCLGAGLGWVSAFWIFYLIVGISVVQIFTLGDRPLRSDYNLFLRSAEKILAPDTTATNKTCSDFPCSKADIFKFARFLGNRWLINDYRQSPDGLVLFLTPIKASFLGLSWNLAYLVFWKRCSNLTLRTDGTVLASLHKNEIRILDRMRPDGSSDKSDLELKVATAVQVAWQSFLAGNVSAAEQALGQQSDAEVFLTPTKNSLSTRLQRAFMIAVAVFLLIQMFFINDLLKTLNISIGTPQQMAQQNYQRAMHDLAKAKTAEKRFYALDAAAKESFVAGNIQAAELYAHDLLMLLPKYQHDWNYGNAIQDANLVLGRLAVRNGKIDEAKKYLIAAGKSPGSPTMDSFGPNMSLANDLLAKGERQTVLEYFQLCRKFWKLHEEKLDQWSKEVEAGEIPDFGANLVY
jgi:RNA polymerase sigma factor (sigma-70 family)